MSTLVEKGVKQEQSTITAGQNVVVWGSSGSGKSVLAVNIASELSDLGHSVLLIDADSKQPSLAALMGIVSPGPGITALLRLARQSRLDRSELLRLSEQVQLESSSIWLVPGMNNPERWSELDAQSLTWLASFTAGEFDYVVWDVASDLDPNVLGGTFDQARNQASISLLGLADHLLAIFAADAVGINRFLFDVRAVGRPFTAVANRVRPQALGKNPERKVVDSLYEIAQISVEHLIPADDGFDEQLRTIRPLMLQSRKSKARERIRKLAQDIIANRSG